MMHRHSARTILILIATTVLSGCASLTPEQCLYADWRQIGYTDAVKGMPSARIDEHAQACAKQGVVPDLDAYLRGRSQGLNEYCRPANGFALGRRGSSHIGADCPESQRTSFIDQYNRGTKIYAVESELNSRRSQFSQYRHMIRQRDYRIGEIRAELARKDLSNERRTALLNEFNQAVEEKDNLARQAQVHEDSARRLERRLQSMLGEFGYSH